MRPRGRVGGLVVLLSILALSSRAPAQSSPDPRLQDFQTQLNALAQKLHIPGMSAAIVHQGEVWWSAGFGLAHGAKEEPATPETRYRIASLSKPLAAIVLLQLVEAKRLRLDDLMREFTIHRGDFPPYPDRYDQQPITVRHVMSHTSEGVPGDSFRYNGNAYGDLTWVIEDLEGRAYPLVLQEKVFDPLSMDRSVPGHVRPGESGFVEDMAAAYRLRGRRNQVATFQMIDPTPGLPLDGFDPVFPLPAAATLARQTALGDGFVHLNGVTAAGGVISTVLDLARFDAALDRGQLVSQESVDLMFTPSRSNHGNTLPYGLGWFVEEKEGVKLVWHYGWLPPAVSALYLKVPQRQLTLLLLANNDQLSAKWAWTTFGVVASPFARLFLETFVVEQEATEP